MPFWQLHSHQQPIQSLLSHTPLPHWHVPSKQLLQSKQPCSVTGSQMPSPQKQSLQFWGLSPMNVSHSPLPQYDAQSPGQYTGSSPSQTPLPQIWKPQSGQSPGLSSPVQRPSPQ
jgi:hypothetical protein